MRNGPTGIEIHDAIEDLKTELSEGEPFTDALLGDVAKDHRLKPELLRRKFEDETGQRPEDYAAPAKVSHEQAMRLRGRQLESRLDPVAYSFFRHLEPKVFGRIINFEGRKLMAVAVTGDLHCLDWETGREVQIVWQNRNEAHDNLNRLIRGEAISGRLKG
ncbi:hypothetical protein GCM10011534_12010 [Pseudooceanicola nanhaiensis]|uniref:Uncharacterized protein n=1 Tax=Pseudooceanicola nanhaiensis TaxID=375761 RepID=A0A917SQD1_9RHOB|nr:hypothetical protein [Pseudooceanicola nanhaiensis]GGL91442.1 hypothetical protein GCM10011534_12010 [Pseudooceanicola nanhaiensis]